MNYLQPINIEILYFTLFIHMYYLLTHLLYLYGVYFLFL